MCETQGRRCPLTEHKRDDHNRRRRENRKIRAQIKQFAAGRDDAPSDLQAWPIDKQKDWARDVGANPSVLQPYTKKPPINPWSAAAARSVPPAANREKRRSPRLHPAPTRPVHLRPGGENRPNRRPIPAEVFAKLGTATDLDDTKRLQILNLHMQVDANDDFECDLYKASMQQRLDLRHSGVNETVRVGLAGGGEGYFKSFSGINESTASAYGDTTQQQPVHEVAAWQFARNLGDEYASLVAPCAMREYEGKWGSLSRGTPGRAFGHLSQASRTKMLDRGDVRTQLANAAFFDVLVGNMDRHEGNFMANHQGITLIDHGFAFTDKHLIKSRIANSRIAGTFGGTPNLTEREVGHLDRLLKSADALGLAGVLEERRVDRLLQRARGMRQSGTLSFGWL